MMQAVIERIRTLSIVPVVRIDDPADALPLADALCRGGLSGAEITFRTDAAEEAIHTITASHPEMLVGAGTVLTPLLADRAMAAGAAFLVSPGTNPMVVGHAAEHGYPIIPGVCTPTEVEAAMQMGFSYLKFFPAEAAGGTRMISAMSAPYTNVRFMPTGGISAENAASYLSLKAVFACGGSWMVSPSLLREKRFDEIERLAKEAATLVATLRK